MSEIIDERIREAEEEKLLDSLIIGLTKSGAIEWERRRFGIYEYTAQVGIYTFKLLKSNHNASITIYISTKDAEEDLHANGKEVWYFLTGKKERPDRLSLIQELQKRAKA